MSTNLSSCTGAPRLRRVVITVAFALALALARSADPAAASDPASHRVELTTTPGTTIYSWTGEVKPGAHARKGTATTPCANNEAIEDVHEIDVVINRAFLYRDVNVTFRFILEWEPVLGESDTADIELEIINPAATSIGESTSGDRREVVIRNLSEGVYKVVACPNSVATPQPYRGRLELTTVSRSRRPATVPAVETPPPAGTSQRPTVTGRATSPPAAGGPATRPAPFASGAPSAAPGAGTSEEPALPPAPADPPAFRGFLQEGNATSVAPAPAVATDVPQVPMPLTVLVSALGLAGGGAALLIRNRRGLDVAEIGTAINRR